MHHTYTLNLKLCHIEELVVKSIGLLRSCIWFLYSESVWNCRIFISHNISPFMVIFIVYFYREEASFLEYLFHHHPRTFHFVFFLKSIRIYFWLINAKVLKLSGIDWPLALVSLFHIIIFNQPMHQGLFKKQCIK